MPASTDRTAHSQPSLRRWIMSGAIVALISFVLETVLQPTSAIGPILFAVFLLGVLTVVVASVILIVQRGRPDRAG